MFLMKVGHSIHDIDGFYNTTDSTIFVNYELNMFEMMSLSDYLHVEPAYNINGDFIGYNISFTEDIKNSINKENE